MEGLTIATGMLHFKSPIVLRKELAPETLAFFIAQMTAVKAIPYRYCAALK